MKKYSLLFLLLFCLPFSLKAKTCPFDFSLSSQNYAIFDYQTGQLLCSTDMEKQISIASLTKLMTYLVARETLTDLNQKIPVTQAALNGLVHSNLALVGFEVGEEIPVKDLLYALLLPSSNDAAVILAAYIGDNQIAPFIELMNQKARSLGCTHTHFINPYGGDDQNHYSTMSDLYRIVKEVMKDKFFQEIVSTKEYTIAPTNLVGERHIRTTNGLMRLNTPYYTENTIGLKTGTTDDAGYCLISRNKNQEYDYLVFTLGADDVLIDGKEYNGAFLDSKHIYTWLWQNYSVQEVVMKGSLNKTIAVKNGKVNSVGIETHESLTSLLPNHLEKEFTYIWNLPPVIEAPVDLQKRLGTVKVLYQNKMLGVLDLYPQNIVEKKEYNIFLVGIMSVSIIFLLCLIYFGWKRHNKKSL